MIRVVIADDEALVRRYALAEAKTFNERLKREDVATIVALAGELEVEASLENGTLRMHFTDFLSYTSAHSSS